MEGRSCLSNCVKAGDDQEDKEETKGWTGKNVTESKEGECKTESDQGAKKLARSLGSSISFTEE